MQRNATKTLEVWFKQADRKPLVIRGARQVGKTYLVRQFANLMQLKLLEMNFERRPELKSLFVKNDPAVIIENLEATFNTEIDKPNTLLFLDEIQAAPELLAKLRWFAEECAELAVVTAGSLLEFVLADHNFSMPVGRIRYLFLEPLSFEEFLLANNKQKLFDYLQSFQMNKKIPDAIHNELMDLIKEFVFVGGLPAAVASWCQKRSMIDVDEIHYNLLATYRDDFSKYTGKLAKDRLEDVLLSIPKQLAEKIVYSRINPDVQSAPLKQGFKLLCDARLCHSVICTHANGLPLGAETNDRTFKAILLDCGLASALLGLQLRGIQDIRTIQLTNQDGLREQLVGQLLRFIFPHYIDPQLFYWTRQQSGVSAEIDYITQHNQHIIPIEVKSGTTGTLKSLHYFMEKKQLSYAVRINGNKPSVTKIDVKTTTGKNVKYTLLSIPFYLIQQYHRLINFHLP
jgi:uncharacterized protein